MRKLDKLRKIESEVDTETIHRFECGWCEDKFETKTKSKKDFVFDIEPRLHYAKSKEYGLQGFICDECFNNEKEDWEEYDPS